MAFLTSLDGGTVQSNRAELSGQFTITAIALRLIQGGLVLRPHRSLADPKLA